MRRHLDPERYLQTFKEFLETAKKLIILHKEKGWQKHNYLALGCTAPPALLRFLSEYQKIYQVVLCLDNDGTGVKADAIILETLQRLSEGMYVENLSEEMRGQLRRPYEVSVLKSVKKDGMMI